LGYFFRAHPAWYTEHAPDRAEWGFAAFGGRSATHIAELQASEGLYTLILQGPHTTAEVISSLSAVHPGADLGAWRGYFARLEVEILTVTITEGGYVRTPAGDLNFDDPGIRADVAALQADPAGGVVVTAPGKFVAGLLARRAAEAAATGAGSGDTGAPDQRAAGGHRGEAAAVADSSSSSGTPTWRMTFLPCDNVVDSGQMIRLVTTQMAAAVDPSLLPWIDDHITFVATMVDRITPHTTAADLARVVELTGHADPAVVVTEPFSEWVIEGEFAAGRPAWESVGAHFVADITAYEQRKLWLLNGSHSLMAYAAPLRGHTTVGQAMADPVVAGWVNQWWDEASRHIELPADDLAQYRRALVERFSNPAIHHLLSQIVADGSQKVPMRFGPTLRAELAAGRIPAGATRAIAAWILHLRGQGPLAVNDVRAADVIALAAGELPEAVARVLAWLGVERPNVEQVVLDHVAELTSAAVV
jgi:fructuronate reductase